ncbi:EKC/KEOPS complex subunit GON7 [Ammospiza nelsoni]|uniref:EKC/KEOPS complex subunit GON7 n=1 Tax=Melospiza georgiana TaxID=44398 RepID=UPI0025AD00AA|nr:EKC/KEOPS complex subunit GON7 [Melospiza georgiana]XP_058662621.1 EKC/KEOPS complex subunit GON7 [Ammospiza caudacuta]XP_059329626.1 EKC/KEOPS complex subunit GON7 [Ammospiza nelsoni]
MAELAAETEPEPGPGRDLVAELRGRDGRTRTVRVPYPAAAEGEAAQLRGLRAALSELQERVVELLAPLVQEERAAAGGARRGAGGDDDDDYDDEEEDEGEDENNVDAAASGDDPPVKRTKVQQP